MEKIIINDHIQGDPLSEKNLNKTLEYVNRFRLLMPEKTIWLYTGYEFEMCKPFDENGILKPNEFAPKLQSILKKRWEIIKNIDVLVDGRYIDSQRNLAAKWRGSSNQRVINIQESFKQNKIILHCD